MSKILELREKRAKAWEAAKAFLDAKRTQEGFVSAEDAATLTTALAALGPGGIVGGVMTLCVLGVIADGIAEYGFDAIVKGVLKELYCRGESKEGIKEKVSKYPISSKLKSNLYDVVDKFA